MKKYLFIALLGFICTACGSKFKLETVKDDPLQTRIYTLDNGLKVYMSVNAETPRLQAYVTVRVGSKNDPAESTGLAHYFEHLMFKGTPHFGTANYPAEKPLLDQIESLFEQYRHTTDATARRSLYRRIDSLSFEASKYAIPNEYDKLMSTIGATNVNAFTAKDVTVYHENIPSNEIENWLRIQSDRLRNPVIRGFHTELETIYEEKNMSLTNDPRKVMQALDAALFPNHPYGQQEVLGTQQSLKNPSITNVKEYHRTYYVPNNMALCFAGDFDPDVLIELVNKYLGDMQPNNELPHLTYEPEPPITTPIVREVYGPDAQNIALAWRLNGAADDDSELADFVANLLYNGKAGLIDANLNQPQRLLSARASTIIQPDYGKLQLRGAPKAGQSLDDVRELLLAEVDKLRRGDFDESLIEGTLNNCKVFFMQTGEDNEGRVQMFTESFINNTPWEREVHRLDKLSKITKEQVVAWANEHLGAESYVAVYKRQGRRNAEKKIAKPRITPIVMNRDLTSDFVAEIQRTPGEPIEPLFLDYKRDLDVFHIQQGIEVLYKQNRANDLFKLTYLFDTGILDNPRLSIALRYLQYLGTPTRTVNEIYKEFYDLACDFSLQTSTGRTTITITGLDENMSRAMEIVEELMANAQPNETTLANLKTNQQQHRKNRKLSQDGNRHALQCVLFYGPQLIERITMKDDELLSLTSEQLLSDVRSLADKQHRILYYGPREKQELRKTLKAYHSMAEHPAQTHFCHLCYRKTPENRVFIAPFQAKQAQYFQFSNLGGTYDPRNAPEVALYNEYFSNGMNSVVFQEMREARSLAYMAEAQLIEPDIAGSHYGFVAYIGTQHDKLPQAVKAFDEIINNMPLAETSFNIAKEALLTRLRTERVVKDQVLWSYLGAQDLGTTTDHRRRLFEQVQSMTLADVKAAQERWVCNREYYYGILGNPDDMDMEYISGLGPVEMLTQEEIFGY